jgi:hypothetical protein
LRRYKSDVERGTTATRYERATSRRTGNAIESGGNAATSSSSRTVSERIAERGSAFDMQHSRTGSIPAFAPGSSLQHGISAHSAVHRAIAVAAGLTTATASATTAPINRRVTRPRTQQL